jgi:D-amino-acid oxidase
MSTQDPQHIAILGAGIIGLTSALVLAHAHPSASITITATHFPGDRSIDYTSPWAGANWSSMANDNGPLENYDRITFQRFGELMDGRSVHGCRVVRSGEGNEAGLGRQQMWAVLDAPIEQTNLLTPQTGRIWYDELVGGLRYLDEEELPEGAVFGLEFPSTFRINTQVYLQWYVTLLLPFPSPPLIIVSLLEDQWGLETLGDTSLMFAQATITSPE